MTSVLQTLAALVAVQKLDTAAESVRRRLAELPLAEQAIERQIAAGTAEVERAKVLLAANQHERRELEKRVAGVDSRMSRFDDHKAAVKTNQEYTALLHEIAIAKAEKDTLEEQILVLMEAADTLTGAVQAATGTLTAIKTAGDAERARIAAERGALEADVARLRAQKVDAVVGLDKAVLARYEKLLEQRKMLAVAPIDGELCTACHVRLRPAVIQVVRRNSEIVACDSCQRLLYAVVPDAPAAEAER